MTRARATTASTNEGRSRAALPTDRAFIVQLRADSPVTLDGVTGRVEHVVSGVAASFTSVAELLGFISEQLARRRATDPPTELR